MGRSQSQLRDPSRQGVDSRGETYAPGSDYARNWAATWPSGSLARHSQSIVISGATLPATAAEDDTATATFSVMGVPFTTDPVDISELSRAAALTAIALEIETNSDIDSAVAGTNSITVTGNVDKLLANGSITHIPA
jgi:hypothetical protein